MLLFVRLSPQVVTAGVICTSKQHKIYYSCTVVLVVRLSPQVVTAGAICASKQHKIYYSCIYLLNKRA